MGLVSVHGKGFVAEILPPLCSVNVPTQPNLVLPLGFLGTKQGADGVGTCTAADACAQVCDTSTLPHPCIPPVLKFPVGAEISLQRAARTAHVP